MNTFEDRYRTWHTYISYTKSAVRILAGVATFFFLDNPAGAIAVLAGGLVLAELLGIAEEFV